MLSYAVRRLSYRTDDNYRNTVIRYRYSGIGILPNNTDTVLFICSFMSQATVDAKSAVVAAGTPKAEDLDVFSEAHLFRRGNIPMMPASRYENTTIPPQQQNKCELVSPG